jgi:hypothetical protein
MSPHDADIEHLMNTNGFTNGALESTGFGTNVERTAGISVHLTTFNCANLPHPRFPLALPAAAPDIIVLGLQELAPSHITFLNLDVIENTYLKGLGSVPEIVRKEYGREYEQVKIVRIGQTALVVWSSLGRRLRKVKTAWAGCGLFGLLANKGAAAARLTFVTGIISPDCTNCRRRKGKRNYICCGPSRRSRRPFLPSQRRFPVSCSEPRF